MVEFAIIGLLIIVVVLLIFLIVSMSGASGKSFDKVADKIVGDVRDELRLGREESSRLSKELRGELSTGMKTANDTLSGTLSGMGTVQKSQLEGIANRLKELTDSNRQNLDKIRDTLDFRMKEIGEGNEKKLDEMRKTVDEKLHGALEKRLGESFKLVSERLEAVQRGLGEMSTLATGVGDLKRVLTNVKTRGTWAEIQLGSILEQILSPGQYEKNVKTVEGSQNVVEFAVKLPGPKDDPEECVWLPIDSKFPQEDYLRLQEAADQADAEALQNAARELARTVKDSAKEIHDKYISPPGTTDFAIMFLATEGLYAEVIRQPGLMEEIQRRFRVVITGPTTLSATLSSLRMGFQTLAIEKRSAEVWRVLGAVKTEFGKFGEVLDRVKNQLNAASNTIEKTSVRTRVMAKQLRTVEQLPESDAESLLRLGDSDPNNPDIPDAPGVPDVPDISDDEGDLET